MSDQHDKKDLKHLIEQQISKTEEKIAELKLLTQPISPENAIGRISRMDAINNKSINDAALLKSREKLKHLNLALGRLDQDDFGFCAKCKTPIQTGRILLMPESVLCIRCAAR